jgi:hypothetical protein
VSTQTKKRASIWRLFIKRDTRKCNSKTSGFSTIEEVLGLNGFDQISNTSCQANENTAPGTSGLHGDLQGASGPYCTNQDRAPDASTFYEGLEDTLRLSRLEEERVLVAALRLIIRLQPRGKHIAFPVPQAVDRIQLKSYNLPTDERALLELLHRVYQRRGEILDLDTLHDDFVRAYGKIVFDTSQSYPKCYIVCRYPT